MMPISCLHLFDFQGLVEMSRVPKSIIHPQIHSGKFPNHFRGSFIFEDSEKARAEQIQSAGPPLRMQGWGLNGGIQKFDKKTLISR